MTESDWLEGENPFGMYEHLRRSRRIHRTKAGQRRLRLFVCGCFRLLWPLLTESACRAVVELGERMADGHFESREIWEAHESLRDVHLESVAWDFANFAAGWAEPGAPSLTPLIDGVLLCLDLSVTAGLSKLNRELDPLLAAHPRVASFVEPDVRAALMREVFGNPFNPVVPDVAWLDWNDGAVWKLAKMIYNEHRFNDLPILADALEEAGCTESPLIEHCRSSGTHVRGCWAVDLLLGKG